MISDDDVMRLFEEADPARRPDRANDHVAGAGYLTALQQQRSIDMTITESPQTTTHSPWRRHWALMGAAAAVAALVIGLVAVIARDNEPPAPADSLPPAPTAQPSAVDVAQRFFGALNDRDQATLQALMGSDAVSDSIPVEDLPAHIAALEAWNWTWDVLACEPETVDADARCEIAARNRLTDLTGTELAGSSLLTVTDGTIDRVHLELDFSDYSPNAFTPFTTWLSDNHPDDDQTIFGDNNPFRQTTESAALLDQHLTEYIDEIRAEVDLAERFYVALNDRDLATLQSLMGDDAVYDENIGVDDLPAHLTALEAWDWEWDEVACEPDSVDADVRCEIAVRNRLTELTGTELAGYSLFTMIDGEVDRVNLDGLDFSDYSPNAFMPFESWLQDNHPDDYQTISGENDWFRQTAASAALLDQHLTEYITEVRAEAEQ